MRIIVRKIVGQLKVALFEDGPAFVPLRRQGNSSCPNAHGAQ